MVQFMIKILYHLGTHFIELKSLISLRPLGRLSASSQQSTHHQQQQQLKEADIKPFEAIPSPEGRLPLLGHMHKLDMTKPWVTFDGWRQELGEIYRC